MMTAEEIKHISLEALVAQGGFDCACGRRHEAGTKKILLAAGAIARLPELLRELGSRRPFILSGHDSFAAAGERVLAALERAAIPCGKYVFPRSPLAPTEHAVGAAVMHFDYDCDAVIAVGSGVINDTGKLLARATGRPYIIVATAPSMDGYMSATSSMDMDGLKVSLPSQAAWAVVGDLDVLCQAPMRMLQAGVGDMLAKYISLCEWQIAGILVDEYYCPVIAALVESALDRVVKSAEGLIDRDPVAVKAVMEGMLIAGAAMSYAGLSRPASGMEHYISHIMDMRALAFEEAKSDLHGIQCGMATLTGLRAYAYLRGVRPDRERALRYAASFSLEDWNRRLSAFIGPGSDAMIAGERREGKYDREKHRLRLEKILDNWDRIMVIVSALPEPSEIEALMGRIGAPLSPEYLGYDMARQGTVFTMTKDIRDKYVGTRLLWDLGLLDEAREALFEV